MTKEEAKKFGLQLLHGIMERNESYPVYANNVKQAIDALSELSGNSEIPKDLLDAQVEIVEELIGENNNDGENAAHPFACEYVVELLQKAVSAGAKWQYQKDRGKFAQIKAKTWSEGFDACKRQMMKEAVEYEVGMHGEPIEINFDKYVQRARGIFPGDKVRIIVIPNTDEK